MRMHTVCACVMNTWTTYRYIDTYIHKYSDFLVELIIVGSLWLAPIISMTIIIIVMLLDLQGLYNKSLHAK